MEILLKYLKYNCYCIRHYNVQLEYKTQFLCSLNMTSISWSQMKAHLKKKLGYFMSSPRVERIILSRTILPFSELALELSLGSHISSTLRPSNQKVPIPSSRIAISDPDLVNPWNCFSLATSDWLTKVYLPQIDLMKMNSGIFVRTTKRKY